MVGTLVVGNTIASRLANLALMLTISLLPPVALSYEPQPNDYRRAVDPALGISDAFGRWNSQINLVYDPDGAPALFANNADVLDLIEEAAGEWELVSGIRFNVVGADANVPDDDNEGPNGQDGLVRIFWGSAGGAAGLAGPNSAFYEEDLGHYLYKDGSVEINDDPELWESKSELVPLLVHELGHLMSLGHSDNPNSIMFANPYNHLNHPRADDILAARALYGTGSMTISDVTKPISQWLYTPPAQASASATANIFKANGILNQGSFIALDPNKPLSEVNAQTTNDAYLWFYFAIGPKSTGNIDIDATIVIVDPFGYVYEARQYQIECERNFSCYAGTTIGDNARAIKTVPGSWKVYVVDNATNTRLHEYAYNVVTTSSYNKGPEAKITVTSVSNTVINVSLDVSDAEDDDIEVIWHSHGNFGSSTGISDFASDGDKVSRNITFLSANTHTLFIELRDDSTRYNGTTTPGSSGSGDGFQNLIAVTVKLPVSSSSDISTRQSYLIGSNSSGLDNSGGNTGPKTGIVLINAIAETSALQIISTSDKSTTTAKFGAGATKDAGVTTGTQFTNGDDIVIAGSISPQLGDIGFGGDIFVVLYTSTSLSYLDLDGNYIPWAGSLKNIQPAFERDNLLLTENFELFSGIVQSGLYRMFIGYRVTEGAGGPIHFNAKAFRITVD